VKHERATEEIRELAALYALGSLTQHEARSFEIHLQEGCDICEAEIQRFARTLAEMGFAAEEVPAPDYLRDLLLARIEREGKPAAKAPAPSEKDKVEIPKEKPFSAAASPLFGAQPKRENPRILPWILAAALVVLAIIFFFSWKMSKDTSDQLLATLSASQTDLAELQKQIDAGKEKSADLEQIWVIINKPGARIARLIGQTAPSANVGAILWDTEHAECLALGSILAAPQGKAYQLWFFSATKKIPVGLIRTDAEGRFFMKFPVPKDAAGATAVVITLEPDNGSEIPTAPYSAAGRID
jgi:anti-sigma-K factor RskA